MATVAPTNTDDTGSQDGSVQIYTWSPLTSTNADGAPVRCLAHADRSVHVYGTFGAGTLVIEGSSNGGASYVTLKDAQGSAISLTAEGLKQIVELPILIRPKVTGADGSTSLSIVMVCRRSNPMRT